MDYDPNERPNWPPPPAPGYGPPNGYIDPAAQALKDYEHLRLLSIFHVIFGIFTAVTCSIGLFHVGMGLMMANNPAAFNNGARTPNAGLPSQFGYMMAAMGGAIVLGGWVLGGLNIAAAHYLKKRRGMTFLMVVAGLDCLAAMPIGTVLGVFTFIVLMRPSVKALFQGTALY